MNDERKSPRHLVEGPGNRKAFSNAAAVARRGTVTVHDVARYVGVSSMTVSRVVNGTKVSEALRAKVQAAIEELHYVPNLAARAARTGSSRIGILLSNPRSSNLGDFLTGAFRQSGASGAQLLVEPLAARSQGVEAVRRLTRMGVDGMILPPPLCDSLEALDILWQAGIPVLSFATSDPRPHSSAVLIDDFAGARAITRHLIAFGHRDIAFVRGDPEHSPARRREEGFRAAMVEASLPLDPARLLDGMFTYRSALEIAPRLLDRPGSDRPSAIFACNDDMAAAISATAHGLGLRIPGDLSIVGFDDTPIASLMWPQLTTVHQPITEMAAVAVEILMDHLRQRRAGASISVRHHVAPFELRLRGSSGPPG